MIRPKIIISKKNAIAEISTPANTERAIKRLKEPGVHLKLISSTKPILQQASGRTDQSPRERLHLRTRELTAQAGRAPLDVTQGDYEEAKREVTGEKILSRQNAVLDPVA